MELTKEQLQKHGEVILAWANGAEVEWQYSGGGDWWDCPSPLWLDGPTYRVKPQPTYEQRQAAWVKETGVKVGDTVRIMREFEDHEAPGMGWISSMAKQIGKTGKVTGVYPRAIRVGMSDGQHYYWPYFCLEPAPDTYQPYPFEQAKKELWGRQVIRKVDGVLRVADQISPAPEGTYSTQWWLDNYTFPDGSPCGTQDIPSGS